MRDRARKPSHGGELLLLDEAVPIHVISAAAGVEATHLARYADFLTQPDGPTAIAEGTIDDAGVRVGDGAREAFVNARVLRTGRIGDTVLSAVPGIARFPGRILGLSETKRYARTASGGHAIYERVTWPARHP